MTALGQTIVFILATIGTIAFSANWTWAAFAFIFIPGLIGIWSPFFAYAFGLANSPVPAPVPPAASPPPTPEQMLVLKAMLESGQKPTTDDMLKTMLFVKELRDASKDKSAPPGDDTGVQPTEDETTETPQ
jgi:hypothetical protein